MGISLGKKKQFTSMSDHTNFVEIAMKLIYFGPLLSHLAHTLNGIKSSLTNDMAIYYQFFQFTSLIRQ